MQTTSNDADQIAKYGIPVVQIATINGCHLTEACLQRLLDAGFRPYWHQRVPPNDGGISLGQVVAAAGTLRPRVPEKQLATA